MGKKVVIKKNPVFEWCIMQMGGQSTVPTKQEKYKPLLGYEGVLKDEKDNDIILKELYVRNPDKDVVKRFEEEFRKFISENLEEEFPIKPPTTVEIVLSILVEKSRYFEVDVDNLAKTVLDCLKGLVIVDDSQVINLLIQKEVHPFNIPGIGIGLRKVDDKTKSLFDSIKLYYYEEFED